MDVSWILEGLKQPGKTQRGLAAKLNLDPAAVNRLLKGKRRLKADEVALVREYLNMSSEPQRTNGIHVMPKTAPPTDADKIPVLGSGEGGEEGWFPWNGDLVDRVPRPPNLSGVPNAYAIYVSGTSMEPRYHPGETLFIHPGKPVDIGSYVLVQAVPKDEGDPPRAFVKRLARRSATKIILEQYNPPRTFEIAVKDLISMHRIMGSGV